MADQMIFDYFYGQEAEMFSFYRIPRMVVKDAHFATLSSDAKILYGLVLDRMSMSVKNGWQDDEDRTYIYYTIEDVMEDLNCGNKKAGNLRKELEEIGLIERVKRGQGKPDIIYVKNYLGVQRVKDNPRNDDFDVENEAENDKKEPAKPHKHSDVSKRHFKKCQNDTSRNVESTLQEMSDEHFKECQSDTTRNVEMTQQEMSYGHANYNNTSYNNVNQNKENYTEGSYTNPISLSSDASFQQSGKGVSLMDRKKEASIPTVSLDPDFRLWDYNLDTIKNYLQDNNGLSRDIVEDPEGLKFVIMYLTNWDNNIEGSDGLFKDTYILAVESLIEMMLTKTPQVYDRQEVRYMDVINRFNYLYRKKESFQSMEGFIFGCVSRYTNASQEYARNNDEIRNPKAYMKSTVWNTLGTYNLDFNTEVSKMSSCWL